MLSKSICTGFRYICLRFVSVQQSCKFRRSVVNLSYRSTSDPVSRHPGCLNREQGILNPDLRIFYRTTETIDYHNSELEWHDASQQKRHCYEVQFIIPMYVRKIALNSSKLIMNCVLLWLFACCKASRCSGSSISIACSGFPCRDKVFYSNTIFMTMLMENLTPSCSLLASPGLWHRDLHC